MRVTVAKPGSSAVTRCTPVRTGRRNAAALIGDGHERVARRLVRRGDGHAGQHAAGRVR